MVICFVRFAAKILLFLQTSVSMHSYYLRLDHEQALTILAQKRYNFTTTQITGANTKQS